MDGRFKHLNWMAWRHLVARKGQTGLSFMTTVSVAGVAVGVATLIIVLSVMAGFENNLVEKMLRGEPHLEIISKNVLQGFSLAQYPLKKFEALLPEATGVESFTKADVVLKHRKNLQSAELIGVEKLPEEAYLWIFARTMQEGSADDLFTEHVPLLSEDRKQFAKGMKLPGIILGQSLANNLGVMLGDEITILNPAAAADAASMSSNVTSFRRYVLTGTFSSGSFNFDSKWAVVRLEEGRRFLAEYDDSLEIEKYVTGVAINLKDPQKVDHIAQRLRNKFPLEVLTWQQSNQALLFALKLEKFAMGSILMLIVLVAAFSISGTMMMTVHHRRTQISLMRALGMTQRSVAMLHMMQGFAIGTVGILVGLLFGLGICLLLQQLRLINLPVNLYHLQTLPVRLVPVAYVVICLSAWILSLLAALYPALTASRQEPSAGLRNE